MKKFYLFCNAGMSTSLLASRMQKVADENNLSIEVKAYPEADMDAIINSQKPDVILLGPQVRHIYDKTVEKYGHIGSPIMVIDADDYGTMNGERILKRAILNYKKGQEK